MTIGLSYAARSEVRFSGDARARPGEVNLHSAYAGPHLLAVADGSAGTRFRSHEKVPRPTQDGAIASAAVVESLCTLDIDVPEDRLLVELERGVHRANQRLHHLLESHPSMRGMGTTLTAMLWSGPHIAMAHIGDSRAYLLRDEVLYQITQDHTLVRSLIDEGRISEDQAAFYPDATALVRALRGAGNVDAVDLTFRKAELGDRYLLCSGGLSRLVTAPYLHETLSLAELPATAAQQLINLTDRSDVADNMTCVIADVVELTARTRRQRPVVAGAAGTEWSSSPSAASARPAFRAEPVETPPPARTKPLPPGTREDIPIRVPADFTVDGYEIFESLGEGGAATVYRAKRTALGRDVAIKVIHRRLTAERDRRRFRREVDAMVRLSEHPNVVTLYDADTLGDGRPYLVMELCPDGSLADRVRRDGPLPAHQVREIGIQVADAVAAAHDHHVLHRDIKPGNLLLTRFGRVALADFGIAALPTPGQELSVTLSMTPVYAPPEVLEGGEPSVTGDIYSLGATLYALLAGRAPFAPQRDLPAVAMIAHLLRVQHTPVPDIPGAPPGLMAVLRAALRTDPAERYKTAAQLRDAITAIG